MALPEKPIRLERASNGWRMTVNGNPVVKTKDGAGLTFRGRPNFVEGAKEHRFDTKVAALGAAHSVGKYILRVGGDRVDAYTQVGGGRALRSGAAAPARQAGPQGTGGSPGRGG